MDVQLGIHRFSADEGPAGNTQANTLARIGLLLGFEVSPQRHQLFFGLNRQG